MARRVVAGETPERIVEAALRLFAERGFESVSLREITAEADANIAAVNYHFGSKEGLIAAVVERHARPVNEERLERLGELERAGGRGGVGAVEVLEAFFAPLFRVAAVGGIGQETLLKFMGRLTGERGYELPEGLMPLLGEVLERYVVALGRGLPGVGKAEVYWRLHFACGVVAHTLLHSGGLRAVAAGRCDDPSPGEKLRRVVGFCVAGFCHGVGAAAPEPEAPSEHPVQWELF